MAPILPGVVSIRDCNPDPDNKFNCPVLKIRIKPPSPVSACGQSHPRTSEKKNHLETFGLRSMTILVKAEVVTCHALATGGQSGALPDESERNVTEFLPL